MGWREFLVLSLAGVLFGYKHFSRDLPCRLGASSLAAGIVGVALVSFGPALKSLQG